jgi:hypothetical protein
MQFLISTLVILSFFLNPTISKANADDLEVEPTCDEILDKHLEDLLSKDHNGILSLHYQLTMLKLAKKTVKGGHKSLEEYIKKDVERLNKLNQQDPQTLAKLDKLYGKHADDHLKSVYRNIDPMRQSVGGLNFIGNKKIDNDDVASYILFESMLGKGKSEFTKTDLAVTWMMHKLKSKAASTSASGKASAALMSNQIARYTGLVKDVKEASEKEINDEMKKTQNQINNFMAKARKDLLAKNPHCVKDGKFETSCMRNENDELADLMLNVGAVSGVMARNAVNQIAGRTRGKDKVAVGAEKLNSCGGQPYKPKQISFDRIELGVPDKHGMHHAEHAAKHGPSEMSFGPIKCGKHFKKKLLQFDHYVKETCCNEKPTKYSEKKALVGVELDLYCKGFYGIPYIAEVGIKGGVQLEGGLGGKIGLDPKTCKSKGCIYGKGAARPYLALYADLLSGAASIEGGVRWEPYVTAGFCKPEDAPGYLTVDFTPNSVYLYYHYSLGWGLMAKSGNSQIYESKAEHNILKIKL